MNKKEREILKLEENFKDTLQNELAKQKTANKEMKINDIKLVGAAEWKDKINGKDISENLYIVDIEIKEIDENGKERVTQQKNLYLGNQCIGGTLGNNELLYNQSFVNSEPDKMQAVKDLLKNTPEEEIENNSLNKLKSKEMAEVLTAHLGREVSEEEVEKLLEEMDKEEIEQLEEEKEQNKDKDENDLSEKQTDIIKVNGIQKADLNKKVDGKETLGQRLDLQGYDSLYVVYSDKVDDITAGSKKSNTTYSLVGISSDGKAKVLNDEFEIDKSVGSGANAQTSKIRADGTATRDSKDISIYTRKSNGMSIGCENDQGRVNMFLYQKTFEENENVGIQIETSQTQVIPIETREIMNTTKGVEQKDKVQDEIEEKTEVEERPDDIRDFDGNEGTSSPENVEQQYIDRAVSDIYEYGDIDTVFGTNDVRDKLLRELEENSQNFTIDQVIENVKQEMDQDARNLGRERN